MRYEPEGDLQTKTSPGISSETQASPDGTPPDDPELKVSLQRLRIARTNLLSAAVAYTNGRISEGQLRAVRELMEEQKRRFESRYGKELMTKLVDALRSVDGDFVEQAEAQLPSDASPSVPNPPAADRQTTTGPSPSPPRRKGAAEQWGKPAVRPVSTPATPEHDRRSPEKVTSSPSPDSGKKPEALHRRWPVESASIAAGILRRYKNRLKGVDAKLSRLERDYHKGRINSFQYRAIRKHFLKQRQAALRLLYNYHDSLRWEVILEEGKTELLMELNQAACTGLAVYDNRTFHCLYIEGQLPESASEALAFLGTFGSSRSESQQGLMYATHSEEGDTLLLIPGKFTSSLGVFSGDPPAWQARALREVHRNFEIANHQALDRMDKDSLIFPNLGRFIRDQGLK